MSTTDIGIIVAVVVVALIGLRILRRSYRRSVATSIPHVTYVDETLLDLVRTRQIRAAVDYYQKHAEAGPDDAEKVVEYLVGQPSSLMLLVRLRDGDVAPLYMDETLRKHLEKGRIWKAYLYYADKTGTDVQEAQIAVNALAVNPDMKFKPSQAD
jgi:hypothetical protein